MGDFAVVIIMAVMAGAWIYVVMTWMAEGEISGRMGLVTIFSSIMLLAVGVSSPVEVVTYAVLLLFIVAPFTLPLYNTIILLLSGDEETAMTTTRVHY